MADETKPTGTELAVSEGKKTLTAAEAAKMMRAIMLDVAHDACAAVTVSSDSELDKRIGKWDSPLEGESPAEKVLNAETRLVTIATSVAGSQDSFLRRASFALWQAKREGTIIGPSGQYPTVNEWLRKVNAGLGENAQKFLSYSSLNSYASRMEANFNWFKAYGPKAVDVWSNAKKLLSTEELATFTSLVEKGGTFDGVTFPAVAYGEARKVQDVLDAMLKHNGTLEPEVETEGKGKGKRAPRTPNAANTKRSSADAEPAVKPEASSLLAYKPEATKLAGDKADTNEQSKAHDLIKSAAVEFAALRIRMTAIVTAAADVKYALPKDLQETIDKSVRDVLKVSDDFTAWQTLDMRQRHVIEERARQAEKDKAPIVKDTGAPLPDANKGAEKLVAQADASKTANGMSTSKQTVTQPKK